MNTKLKRIIVVALVAMLWMLPTTKANAETTKRQLEVNTELTEWILDEAGNTLYAISKNGKSLLFINATTMQLEKTLRLPGGPTDMVLDDGTLYIALNSIHQIAVVDTKTRTCIDTLLTDSDPYSIVKDGNSIFYAEYDQHCAVYRYDLETEKNEIFVRSAYKPDLAVDTNRHILYIGESGSSGSDMLYYSTITGQKLSGTNYDDGYGFGYPSRKLVTDGAYVYFAGRGFDLEDATRFDGDYGKSSTILHAENGLVYTRKDIYDRETHLRLGSYAKEIDLAEMAETVVYLYSTSDDTIYRYEQEGMKVTGDNVMGLISGKAATMLPEVVESDKKLDAYRTLEMKYSLTDWILDENNNTVYAISESEKALLFINATTLDLEKVMHLKSEPKHIYQYGERLYLSIHDAGQILIVNGEERQYEKTIYLSKQPKSCVTDGKKIYYSTKNAVYEYDMQTKKEQKLSLSYLSSPGLALNETDGILYVSEGSSSSSEMYYYDTVKNEKIGATVSFYYPSSKAFFDGEKVYYAGRAFDKKEPRRIYGIYDEEDEEDILLVKNGLVYTESYVFDADTYECVDYSSAGYYTLFEVFQSGHELSYSEEEQLVERIDVEKLKLVIMDPDNGKDVGLFFVDKGGLLTEPQKPARTNYEFLGWYRYDYETDQLTTQWDFAKDRVEEELYLVAKWKKFLPAPSDVKTSVTKEDSSITVSWGSVSQALGYEIYRAEGENGEYTLLSKEMVTVNRYKDKAVKPGVSYRYIVKAVAKDNKEKITSAASEMAEGKLELDIPYFIQIEPASSNAIKLEWYETKNVDGYQIYRATGLDATYELVKEVTGTSYTDSGLRANTVYYYKIRAYKKYENQTVYSEFSNSLGVLSTFGTTTINKQSVSGKKISFGWTKVAGADGYEVYRSTNSFDNYKRVKTTSGLSYQDQTGEDGVTYYYKVRAYQTQGSKKEYSEFSEIIQVATANAAMTTVKAVANADGTVKLTWTKVAKMTEYDVYRSTSKNGEYTLWQSANKLSFTDIWAKPGVTYYYKVVGTRMVDGEKVVTRDSNKVKAKAILSVPGKVKVKSNRKGRSEVSWGSVKNATGFEVYESTSKNGKYKKIRTLKMTKERFSIQNDRKRGKTYYYKVRAYRVDGTKKVYSNYSKVVSVKIK